MTSSTAGLTLCLAFMVSGLVPSHLLLLDGGGPDGPAWPPTYSRGRGPLSPHPQLVYASLPGVGAEVAFGIFWLKCVENSIPAHSFENAMWVETSSQQKGHIEWQVGKLGSLQYPWCLRCPQRPPGPPLRAASPSLHLASTSHSSSFPYCLSQFSAFGLSGEANGPLWNGSWPCALEHRVSSLPPKMLGHLWKNVVRIPAGDWLCPSA